MSIENVNRFFEAANNDAGLLEQLGEIKTSDMSAAIEEVATIATDAGFPFTAEEYEIVMAESAKKLHATLGGRVSESGVSNSHHAG